MKKLEIGIKEDIEYVKVKDKVRVILLNKEGRALITKYAGLYMFPGGKIDEGETQKEALIREVLEETGIDITVDTEIEKATPFLEITSFNKNYYDRSTGKKMNGVRTTSFYALQTNQEIDESKQNLTESEKNQNFSKQFVNLSVIEYMVQNNNTENPRKEIFDKEILIALREFKNREIVERER